jgi:hypothetical protein
MAINRQNQQNIQDTATYVEDTLRSVAANIGEALKEAVDAAFDSKDATVLSSVGKDFVRSMVAAARASEDLVKNQSRITQGLLSSKDVEKQIQTIAERKLELERKYNYTKQLAEDIGKKMTKQQELAFKHAEAALNLQESILQGDKQQLDNIEKQIGLTGKLIGSISKIPGIGQFLKADEINQEMRKVAAEGGGKFKTMGVAAKMVGKQLYEGLLDPLTLITSIWNGFMNVNKASVELQRLTGQNETAMAGMNDRLASSVQFLETAAELTKQLGLSATSVFSPDQIAQLVEAKNLLGFSAEQAGKMGMLMKLTGKSVDQVGQGVYDTVNAYNGANRAAINQRMVLEDVLSTSTSITASFSGNEKQLGKAATQAAALGINLQKVDEIAGSLLNFEDSIGAELEAQLMTGKNINLSKARELALNNDLEGVAKELKNNGASAAEFANMNRLEQESLAKALGMSRDELAKSVLTQEAMNNMTDEQVAKARGVTLEQSKAMDVQAKMQLGLQKLAEAFAPVLEGIIPLVDVLLSIIKPIANLVAIIAGNPIGKSILIAVVAVRLLGGGLFGAVQGMGSLAKGALDFVKNLNMAGVSKFFGGIKEKLGQGLAGKVQDKVSDKAGGVVDGLGDKLAGTQDKTKTLNKGAGEGIKGFFQALGTGFQIFARAMATPTPLGPVGVVMAVSLAVITGAIIGLGYALGLAAPGIQAFGTVVTAAFAGIATLITAVADGFVKILGAVTMENIGPMLLLGPALFGIAAGLSAVSLAGLMALPAIGGLVALSLAAPALVSLGIGGENKSAGEAKGKSEESSMLKVLGEIRDAIQKGGDVYLDKDKVGRILDRQGVLTAVVGK